MRSSFPTPRGLGKPLLSLTSHRHGGSGLLSALTFFAQWLEGVISNLSQVTCPSLLTTLSGRANPQSLHHSTEAQDGLFPLISLPFSPSSLPPATPITSSSFLPQGLCTCCPPPPSSQSSRSAASFPLSSLSASLPGWSHTYPFRFHHITPFSSFPSIQPHFTFLIWLVSMVYPTRAGLGPPGSCCVLYFQCWVSPLQVPNTYWSTDSLSYRMNRSTPNGGRSHLLKSMESWTNDSGSPPRGILEGNTWMWGRRVLDSRKVPHSTFTACPRPQGSCSGAQMPEPGHRLCLYQNQIQIQSAHFQIRQPREISRPCPPCRSRSYKGRQ